MFWRGRGTLYRLSRMMRQIDDGFEIIGVVLKLSTKTVDNSVYKIANSGSGDGLEVLWLIFDHLGIFMNSF